LSRPETQISAAALGFFFELIERRAADCPVQYITNKCEFYSLDFYVDENVLIPRPETELLVDLAAGRAGNGSPYILEIGTGSGCVAVSLSKRCSNARIMATDISRPALDVAKKNARLHGVDTRIKFIEHDIFDVAHSSFAGARYDMIISNPPYIPAGDVGGLPCSVRLYEPLPALDGGRDGLSFYRRIARFGRDAIIPGGALFLEIGCDQADSVKKILADENYIDIKIHRDLSGRDRAIGCTKG